MASDLRVQCPRVGLGVGGVNVIAVLKFNAKVGVGAWLEFKI